MTTNPNTLVAGLGAETGNERFANYQALLDMGSDALPAIRQGLRADDRQVRRWSAMALDQIADADALADLVPLLRDPYAGVRLWAVHSIACEHCKDDVECPVDVVPHLIERVRVDPSVRVRRMAVIMLGDELADPRGITVLEEVLESDTDRRLLAHAKRGLERIRGVPTSEPGATRGDTTGR
jgi:HEAT repeat protein